ncbi:MAG: PEP-CTERM sorting domain-containing protein [Phycisphaerales bacterium JB054]
MKNFVLKALVVGAAVSVALGEEVVFENAWDSTTSMDAGSFSDQSQILAGSFDLLAAADVSSASWRGTMFSRDPLDTGDTWSFDVVFYSDNAGVPDAVLGSTSVIADVLDTGLDKSDIWGLERVYEFSAEFADVSLAAGTTYWFSVVNTGQSSTFRWNLGTDANYSGVWSDTGGTTWRDAADRQPLNFILNAETIPLPTSSALAGLGLLGLGLRRRRESI